MADVAIFPEQTLEFSVEGGVAQRVLIPAPFELIIGETYRVALDGVAHVATCVHVDGAPAITNIADPSNPDLPEDGSFLIGYLPPEIAEADGNSVAMVMCIDRSNAPTHTLAIYQTAAVSNDVITENWDGSTEVHPGVESVSLETEDGGEKEFILADLVPETVEKTVELDFSGGDMIVTPKKGQAFSTILIPKPDNLIPDNIAADKDVAGIIGALVAGGGGGGNIVAAQGEFIPTSTVHTINHNLGVVPDVAAVICTDARLDTSNYYALFSIVNFSKALYAKGITGKALITMASFNFSSDGAALDGNDPDGQGILANATDTTMSVGSAASWIRLVTNKKYCWIAIGGLT